MKSYSPFKYLHSQLFIALIFIFSGTLSTAQTIVFPSEQVLFTLNFETTIASSTDISFQRENNNDGTFDFVVIQKGNPIFRFSNVDDKNDKILSFALITKKEAVLKQINEHKNTDLSDLLTEFSDSTVAYIGLLECKTPNGAIKRMQVAKFEEETEEEVSIR